MIKGERIADDHKQKGDKDEEEESNKDNVDDREKADGNIKCDNEGIK